MRPRLSLSLDLLLALNVWNPTIMALAASSGLGGESSFLGVSWLVWQLAYRKLRNVPFNLLALHLLGVLLRSNRQLWIFPRILTQSWILNHSPICKLRMVFMSLLIDFNVVTLWTAVGVSIVSSKLGTAGWPFNHDVVLYVAGNLLRPFLTDMIPIIFLHHGSNYFVDLVFLAIR